MFCFDPTKVDAAHLLAYVVSGNGPLFNDEKDFAYTVDHDLVRYCGYKNAMHQYVAVFKPHVPERPDAQYVVSLVNVYLNAGGSIVGTFDSKGPLIETSSEETAIHIFECFGQTVIT